MDTDNNTKETTEPTPQAAQVVQDPAAPVQTEFAEPSKKRRSPKLLIGGILAAAIVVLGAGGVFGYTMWYQNPDKVVHDAILNAIQSKTMQTTGSIVYKSDELTIDIALDGQSGESSGEFTADAKVTVNSGDIQQDFNAKGAGKMVNDTLYVKVSGIQGVVEDVTSQSDGQIPSYATEIFDKIDDKWISISPSDYEDMNDSISKQQKCLTDLFKKSQNDKTMLREVTDLYKKNQIIVIKDKLGSKDVAGVSSLGYRIEVDNAKAGSFVEGLESSTIGKEIKACDEDIDFKEIVDDLTKETEKADSVPTMELWVSTFGHTITEFAVKANEDNNSLDMSLRPTFNKNVSVEAPSDATPLKTVLEDIQKAIMDSYSEMYSGNMMLTDDMLRELESEI